MIGNGSEVGQTILVVRKTVSVVRKTFLTFFAWKQKQKPGKRFFSLFLSFFLILYSLFLVLFPRLSSLSWLTVLVHYLGYLSWFLVFVPRLTPPSWFPVLVTCLCSLK